MTSDDLRQQSRDTHARDADDASAGLRTPRSSPDWGWEFRLEDFVFARLTEAAATAEAIPPGTERTAATTRVSALRHLLALHSTYVSADGSNAARCYTCEPAHGVPCLTLRSLATLWSGHPDMPYDEPLIGPHFDDVVKAGTFRRLAWPHTIASAEEPRH